MTNRERPFYKMIDSTPDHAARNLRTRGVGLLVKRSARCQYHRMTATPLQIATMQSEITPDVRANGRHVRELMARAREGGARLAHFPEGALSGYVKTQVKEWGAVDWDAVREELEETTALAGSLGMWTVLGANHRLTSPNRPHNSLYIISDRGQLVGRYDKRLCSHTEINDWYTPGSSPVVFEVDGYRFGCALCIEIHFPELFMEYGRLGVDCMLFSAYAEDPMFGTTAQAHAEANNMWLSLSTPAQSGAKLPSGLIGPDGHYISTHAGGAPFFAAGQLDREDPRYEVALTKARPWRASARSGEIYSMRMVDDPRSSDRLSF
jgi:predicted amidohydrolase